MHILERKWDLGTCLAKHSSVFSHQGDAAPSLPSLPASVPFCNRADRAGPSRSLSPPSTGKAAAQPPALPGPVAEPRCAPEGGSLSTTQDWPQLEFCEQGPAAMGAAPSHPPSDSSRSSQVELVTLQEACVLTCKALPLPFVAHCISPTVLGGGQWSNYQPHLAGREITKDCPGQRGLTSTDQRPGFRPFHG